ncbi:MAG: hypothetical protein IKC86_05215 [Prevotella sp.]|jgi:hypothetical protein|nr:hypothetical protein [Prevotella sp.]
MKKMQLLVVIMLTTFLAIGCTSDKKKNNIVVSGNLSADTTLVADSTLYGICGEGTAMHTLQLLTDDGRVCTLMKNVDDSVSDIQGGLLVGDRLAVIAAVEYGDSVVKSVINLTTLQGKWVSIDRNFEIREGGVVKSNQETESNPWTSWKICNGRLVLNSDTFRVDELGADSLYLENKDGIFGFKRMK